MAISLTSDPIILAADFSAIVPNITGTDRISFLINSATAAFKKFTGRTAIKSATVVEYSSLPPSPINYTYLHAAPVTSITSIILLYNGETLETLSSDSDYAIENATMGKIVTPNHTVSGRGHGYTLKITYVGGWSTIPADVQAGALELMRLQHSRLGGQAGVTSSSFDGITTTYERGGLPQSVADAWQQYRIF